MSANISVITTSTSDAIASVVADVNGLALAHINGDFAGHNQMRVYNQLFLEPGTGNVIADHTLRIEVYNPNTQQTIVLAVPCFVEGGTVSGGPPVILVEPTGSITLPFSGLFIEFGVQVASENTPSFQWQKLVNSGFTDLAGQTSSIFVIPNAQVSDSGAYQVVVSNSFGSVVSTTGSLVVEPGI